MKLRKALLLIIIGAILLGVLAYYWGPTLQLHYALKNYTKMITTGIPEDLRLIIYYIDPHILTRYPLSIDGLVGLDDVDIIEVDAQKLADHWELLRKLDAAALQPVEEKTYLDVRLYYVFETGDGNKLLEVAISEINGNVFVNGVEVEHDPVFYEIIAPFLSEEDHTVLGF